MSEISFEEFFQKSLSNIPMKSGDLVNGTVVGIDNKFVLVDVGLKSEGPISIDQFTSPQGELEIKLGEKVDVVVELSVDEFGETKLSREKAKRAEAWGVLVKKYQSNETVEGYVSGRVKGGFTVEIQGVHAFLPGSLVDVRPVSDTSWLEGHNSEFKIIKVDDKRNNIVVSRRAVLEADTSAERAKVLDNLEEGQVIKGTVKNLTDYGAFIDLGGIDGLLHVTDISWKRVKLPSDVLKIADEVSVTVLKFDRERGRVSLGMKQLNKDPWVNIIERYPVNSRLKGKVTNLTDYGCFVEIEDGVEGLVHMSEMDWTNKNVHPSKIVQVGEEVEVIVLEIDGERRRISLGMKQCAENPWSQFSEGHHKGEIVKGKIKSITDFGMFIGLDGNIDGLIHLSDISWEEQGEKAIRNFKKGDEVEATILGIDPERERISLGIKQLQNDPFGNYIEEHPKGSMVKGKIVTIEPKQVLIELAQEVPAKLKITEIAKEKVQDIHDYLKEGEEIEAKIIGVNTKDRFINVSLKSIGDSSQGVISKGGKSEESINLTLGDILKEQIENNQEQEE